MHYQGNAILIIDDDEIEVTAQVTYTLPTADQPGSWLGVVRGQGIAIEFIEDSDKFLKIEDKMGRIEIDQYNLQERPDWGHFRGIDPPPFVG